MYIRTYHNQGRIQSTIGGGGRNSKYFPNLWQFLGEKCHFSFCLGGGEFPPWTRHWSQSLWTTVRFIFSRLCGYASHCTVYNIDGCNCQQKNARKYINQFLSKWPRRCSQIQTMMRLFQKLSYFKYSNLFWFCSKFFFFLYQNNFILTPACIKYFLNWKIRVLWN